MNALARWGLVVVAAAGLGIDAFTHLDLASVYDLNKTSTISQGTLFRVEAALAILVGVLLILRANVLTALLVVAVAGGGLTLLLVYRLVDVGKVGPIPNMYEPIWFPEKSWSAIGEAIATAAALALCGVQLTLGRRSHQPV